MTKFRTGKGKDLRDLDIKTIYEKLGPERCDAIIGFHTFTGCDQTGRFNTKSKSSCWDVFMSSSSQVLQAFKSLGISESLPTLETIEALEKFVVSLFGAKKSTCKTLAELRWFHFQRYQHEADKLPPTFDALKYKIFRSHFIAMVLKRSHQPLQSLPIPDDYGWETEQGSFSPIMTRNLPAPVALIEMSSCSCQTGCKTNRCGCKKKNNLTCTDLCKCKDCENFDDDDTDIHIDVNDVDNGGCDNE